MRTTSLALLSAALAFTALPITAQTAHTGASHTAAATRPTTAHTASATRTAGGGCVKLAELSPKIPATPASAGCAKALYTLSTQPDIHLDYAAPAEGDLAKTLGIERVTFTLAYVDTKVGTGALAEPHKYYTVKYTGYFENGTVFDSSDKHPETSDGFTFQVGAHRVVAGWDTGFAGMRVGGKRRLFVPWQLAYGPNGNPPAIPARADLIFDMELVSQSDTAPAPKLPPTPPPAAATPATPPGTAPIRVPPPPASSTPATPPAANGAPSSSSPATAPETRGLKPPAAENK